MPDLDGPRKPLNRTSRLSGTPRLTGEAGTVAAGSVVVGADDNRQGAYCRALALLAVDAWHPAWRELSRLGGGA